MKTHITIPVLFILFWIILGGTLFYSIDGLVSTVEFKNTILDFLLISAILGFPLLGYLLYLLFKERKNHNLSEVKQAISHEILTSLDKRHIFTFLSKETRKITIFSSMSISFLERQEDRVKVTPYFSFNDNDEEINEEPYFIPIAKTGFRLLFEKKQPVIILSKLKRGGEIKNTQTMYLPIEQENTISGAMALHYAPDKHIDKSFIPMLSDIVGNISVALRNSNMYSVMKNYYQKLNTDMELARNTQQNLLPQQLPDNSEIEFHAKYLPSEWLSGDFYNIARIADNLYEVYIVDVSGHSISAALTTVILKENLTDFSLQDKKKPSIVLSKLNEIMLSRLNKLEFATILYGVLDTAKLIFTFANAGHPMPLMFDHAKGSVSEVGSNGPLIGLLDNVEYANNEIKFRKGDGLLLYTDGLSEAENLEEVPFGKEGVSESMLKNIHQPDNFLDNVLSDLKVFSRREHFPDDINLIYLNCP